MQLNVHPSWEDIVSYAFDGLEKEYRNFLLNNDGYFPDFDNFLNAFKTLPLQKTSYILFGQDPYPRKQSAIGYSFIDGAVKTLFSQKGLSKEVNRATSLRNFIKMLLLADGKLSMQNLSQEAIADIDKVQMIDSIEELRKNFETNGVLLLNTALVFTCKKSSRSHSKAFRPFILRVLEKLQDKDISVILFGNMAKELDREFGIMNSFRSFQTPHPYNVSFIKDTSALNLFRPMHLLHKRD